MHVDEKIIPKEMLDTSNSIAAILNTLQPDVAAARAQYKYDQYVGLPTDLNRLATGYIVNTFLELGIDALLRDAPNPDVLMQSLRIQPQHRRLFGRLLTILSEDGLLPVTKVGNDRWMRVDTERHAQELLVRYPESAVEIGLVQRCGVRLAQVLVGQYDPIQLLFPSGSLDSMEAFYQSSPMALYYNALTRAAIEKLIVALPSTQPLRLLEIGAGTGSTTHHLLPILPPDRSRYRFSDLSPLFLRKAEEKFAAFPFVDYELLDIERDPESQGYTPHSYDIVIAANVLHATRDLRITLRHIARLLAPGGRLVLLESLHPQRWIDLVFGLTDGWWRFTDIDLRPQYPLLTGDGWREVLGEVGFVEVGMTNDTDAVQAVILASAPSDIILEQSISNIRSAKSITSSTILTVIAEDGGDRDPIRLWVQRNLATRVARFLRRTPEQISPEANVINLGVDSLMAVDILSELQKELGVSMPPTWIFEYPTLAKLSSHIVQKFRPQLEPLVRADSTGCAPAVEAPPLVVPVAVPAAAPRQNGIDEIDALRQRFCRPTVPDFPLLPLQQSFFIDRMMGRSGCYALTDIDILGELEASLLQEAIRVLVARHPALHLSFRSDSEQLSQRVVQSVPEFILEVSDLSGLPDDVAAVKLDEAIEALARYNFDYTSGQTFVARLYKISPGTHRFIINFDHLAVDGASGWRALDELQTIYRALARSQQVARAPTTRLSFKEYVEIYVAQQDPERRRADEAYWLEKFTDFEPYPDLPEEPERTSQLEGFGVHFNKLDAALTRRVRRQAQTHGVTMFAALIAGFFKLLAIWSSNDRITLNTPYVNRQPISDDVYNILGCLTDIFPLRSNHALDASILTIAQDIQRDLGEIYLHDTVSGVEIARALARKCHVDPRPLSPITFSSHLFHDFSNDNGDEISFFSSRARTGAPETWMDVVVHEEYGELVLSWNYLRSRFSKEWVEVLASQYRDVLEAFCRDARVTHPLASHLTARDLSAQQTLNGAYRVFPVELCLHQWFERSAAARDTQTALVFAEQQLSYVELNTRANRFARHLIAQGVGSDSLVAICLERSIDMVVSILAVLKAGGAYVPLDPAYPNERLEFILADTGTRVLVTNCACQAGLGTTAAEVTIITVDGDADAIAAHDGTNPDVAMSADNLAYVIYTSGSTGRPKGVLISHRNAARLFLATENWFGFSERDVWTLFHSYAFDFSVWELWGALLYGGRLVIVAQSVTRSPDAFHRLLRDSGVTVLNQTPSAFRQLIVADQAAGAEMRLSALRSVIFGGEPLDVRMLRPWFDKYGDQEPRLINMYGITETTVHVTYRALRVEDAALSVSPIGVPIPDLRLYVMDGQLRLQPVGVVGEVYVGGAGVARGYLNRPELTAERFIPDPIMPDTHARLYKTGDLARLTADGTVLFAGRGDAQVKIRGFRIEPGEIESALSAYPDVEDAVVVARDSGQGDKQLVAYLVTRRADAIDLTKLRRRLTETLPDHMIPAAFACVTSLPLTPNGKLDVGALPAPHAARSESAHNNQGPRNAVESRIAALWMRVLKLDTVGIHDRFFELGGDSLTLVHLASLLETEFGRRPEIVQLFELPTIAGQAAFYIDDATATSGETVAATETLAVILDPAERDAYKRKRVALLSAASDTLDINLGEPCAELSLFAKRHSQRRFAERAIPLQQFSDFLSGMRETTRGSGFRYAYASGGATYSVQVYLYLRGDRIQGVNTGVYYYHPQLHRLRHVADLSELPLTIHAPANQSLARDAAFHVFLMYERAAIEPIYGERSRHFALLEAGAAAHQLELSAAAHGIGLCQVGGIGFEALREVFHLNSTQVHLHTLVGGAPSCAAENQSGEPLNVDAASSLSPIVPDAAGRYEPFPLNDIQQAYWIGQTGGFDLGNVSAHYYLEFDSRTLDIDRLEAAWQSVVARHDMLRAVIRSDGRQQILEEVPAYRVVCEDLRSVDVEGAECRLLEARERMSHQMFVADHWPLFEICAHRLADGRVRLHFSMSLLIGDVWSAQVVFRDLHVYYNNPAYMPLALDLSFRDYVLAEAGQRDSVQHRRSNAYWSQRVRELPGPPDLPLAQNPSSVRMPRFTRIAGHLDQARWKRLKAKAAARNLSPSMAVCAAFAEALATWSKNARFCINLTTFQRFPLHPQVNDIVGDFTALSLLETDCTTGNFELRARRMQEQLWRDMEHRHVSGVQVQREFGRLHGRTNGAAMPVVFTSTLIGDDGGIGGALAPEWLGEQVYGSSQTPQVYIDHQVMELSGELVFNWDYVAEIFPVGLVPDMFAAFARVLTELADQDDAWQCSWGERVMRRIPASQLQQRTQVNTTDTPLSKALLHQLFLDQARLAPQHAAIITSDREMNYGELERATLRLAARLRQLNPLPNTLVAIVMDKGWEQVAAVLAIQCSGAAYLPIDPMLPSERMRYLLTHGDVSCALIQPWIEEKVDWPDGITRIIVNDDVLRDGDIPEAVADACVSVTPQDLAYVIFTSGSTGVPKGVMIEHCGAVNTVLDINRRFNVGPEDRVFALSSLSFDLSVYDIFGALAAGAAIVFPDASRAQEPEHWLERVYSAGVTIWNSVPALLNLLADHTYTSGRVLPKHLRLCMLSGDWIPLSLPDAVHRLLPDVRIISLGGATEASIWSIAYPIDAIDTHWQSVPYGRPLDNQRFHVLNEALSPCPVWVPGQLYIGGIGLARGYWKDPDKTAASFITHPRTGERLYRAGDLGRYWSDGNIEFLGREDQQVKINGYRVELGEVETALLQHESVKEVVVHAVGAVDRGRRLVAYVVSTEALSSGATIPLPTQRATRQENQSICAPLSLESISHLLEELRYIELDGRTSCLYGSAGSTYAVQAYLAIADDVVPELAAGVYYYHPERHALLRVATHSDRGGVVTQSFELYCVVQLAALAPLYGERSGAYAMIEAGLITELLNGSAVRQGWSMRPASVDLSPIETFLATDDALVLLAAMTINTDQGVSDAAASTSCVPGVLEKISAALPRFPMLADNDAREDLKHRRLGLPAEWIEDNSVVLDHSPLEQTLETRYRARTSYREFDAAQIPLLALGELLSGIVPLIGAYDQTSDRSAGLMVFLHIKPQRVAGVAAGLYRLENESLSLIPQIPDGVPGVDMHYFVNREIYTQSAFSIYLVAENARRLDQGLMAAGRVAQWLELVGPSMGLGFCQVGSLNFDVLRPALGLEPQTILLHSLLGGAICSDQPAQFADQTLEPEGDARAHSLRQYLRSKLPAYMLPSSYVFLSRLPLTANGKIDRRALEQDLERSMQGSRSYVAPKNDVEVELIALLAEVLGIAADKISVHDNFFDLGGDSMALIKLHVQIEQRYSNQLQIADLFRYPNIAALAEALKELRQDNKPVAISTSAPNRQNDGRRASTRRAQLRQRHRSEDKYDPDDAKH